MAEMVRAAVQTAARTIEIQEFLLAGERRGEPAIHVSLHPSR